MRRAWLIAAALLLLGGLAWLGLRGAPPAPTEQGKPQLMLLTSLPLLFGEQFGLEEGGSPVLTRLEQHYAVRPIDVSDARSLGRRPLLLMAHPRAQPAEALVDLDRWVRRGGGLLLLADPRLSWHSIRPLGDPLRPPPDFADTGLLAHWGLRLGGPSPDGPALVRAGALEILAVTPGRLSGIGPCTIEPGGFVARCRIGRGRATVIADADFLNVADLDGPTAHNLDLVMTELERLAKR